MGRDSTFMDHQFRALTSEADYTPGLVGVFMPFQTALDDEYKAIADSCRQVGLRAHRVDHDAGSGIVLEDIFRLIEDAEFLVFDLTGERPSVYYELGYAHGVGNESHDILLLARAGTKLHYDVAGLRVHYYDSLERLAKIVSRSLAEMIRRTRAT